MANLYSLFRALIESEFSMSMSMSYSENDKGPSTEATIPAPTGAPEESEATTITPLDTPVDATLETTGVTKKKSFNDITPSCDGQPQNEDINALVNVDYLAELDFLSIVQDLVDILSNALSSTFSFCNSEDPRRLAQDDSTSQPFFLGQVSIDDEETGRFLVLPLLEFYSGRHTLRI